ncbi:MAG: phospholipase D-like domain-containing protein [Thermoplasmatota archaeon]
MQSDGNEVDVLVDGEAVFRAARDAIAGARRSLHLVQLEFDPTFVPVFMAGASPTLGSVVKDAAGRGVDVRILHSQVEPVDVLGYEAAAQYFAHCPGIELHPFPLSHEMQHSKIMVVDGEVGFVFGSPFVQAYFDFASHPVVEPRRGKGITRIGSRPFHDVAVRIRGPAVADLDGCLSELWNFRAVVEKRPADQFRAAPGGPAAGKQALQVVRTLPSGVLPGHPNGERGIFEAYLRGLRMAEDFVFIENQYLTSKALAEALRAAVEREPKLEVILLLNPRVDMPEYVRLQHKLQATTLHHPRIQAFSLWATHPGLGRPVLQRAYVHSKSAVIDDVWACLGTANLDGFSLHGAKEVGLPGSRNVETSVVLFDGIAGKPATGLVADTRRRLWSEHLGRPMDALLAKPPAGWLGFWRDVAQANVDALAEGRRPASPVLPFHARKRGCSDAEALRRLGIDSLHLDLKP